MAGSRVLIFVGAIAASALGCASGTDPAGDDVSGLADAGLDAGITAEPDADIVTRPDAAGTSACADEPCYPGVTCTDAPGTPGYTCGPCPSGTQGDGVSCLDVDGCAGDPCYDGVTCTDLPAPDTGYTCGPCPSGTQGDGVSCLDVDGCAGDPCFDGVTCADLPAPDTGYTCGACPSGYDGDGVSCTPLVEPTGAMQCPSRIETTSAGSQDRIDDWACSSRQLTGPEVVYTFVPQHSGTVAASLAGLSADLDLVVFEARGGICDPTDASACAAEAHAAGTAEEFLTWEATAGTTYCVVADGYQGASSSFRLWLGTAASSIYISEIEYFQPDFIELASRSACTVDLVGLAVVHDPKHDPPIEYVIPQGSLVEPGGVLRLVEQGYAPYLANEVDIGVLIDDDIDGVGYTSLCSGSCKSDCSNLIDHVERDNDLNDGVVPAAPACTSFSPGPLHTSAAEPRGLLRVGHSGRPGDFRAADWATGTTTRD